MNALPCGKVYCEWPTTVLQYSPNILRDSQSRLTVDATMGPVCATPLLLSLVDLDMTDVQVVHVKPLALKTAQGSTRESARSP